MMTIRTYSELITIPTYEERFEYLKLDGLVGKETFGFDRYLNQIFYSSGPWRSRRDGIIVRDDGCDLGIQDYSIQGRIYVHHMNPLLAMDFLNDTDFLLNPEYLICTAFRTHQAIHYGDKNLLITAPVERTKNDTCPWRQ